jgi:hypothetical protein
MQSRLHFLLYPRESLIYGKSYEDWTVEWWKWLMQIPIVDNPSEDLKGKKADMCQPGQQVMFLCQTIESSPFPTRIISIPDGTSIFMPVINWLSVGGIDGNDYKELRQIAKQKIDVVKEMKFTINDIVITKEIWDFRVSSRPFEINFPFDNVLHIEPGIRKCISDGYWLFIKPTSLNSITSSGVCSTGETNIGVKYKINVA